MAKRNSPKGCLTSEQTRRYYFLWRRLLRYVNQRKGLVQDFLARDLDAERMPVEQVVEIRDALWSDPTMLLEYVQGNPDGLTPADLELIGQWQHRISGNFIVMRVTAKHALFSGGGEEGEVIYAVKGLESPLDDVLPFIPCYVQAVLLPFEDEIIYDGLARSYSIYIGSNMRAGFKESIADAEERGAIITSLTRKAAPEDAQARVQNTNVRVLKAYEMFLRGTIASEKTVERHLGVAQSVAGNLANRPEPCSLRQMEWTDLKLELQLAATMMRPQEYKQSLTSLKKLVRFLQDTNRIDWDQSNAILAELKRQ